MQYEKIKMRDLSKESYRGRRIKDLTNKKFGRLTVKGLYNIRSSSSTAVWICKCECGNEKNIRSSCLVRGMTKSCGCLRKEIRKERTELRDIERILYIYKYTAGKRLLDFKLSIEEFTKLLNMSCFYCGILPYKNIKERNLHCNEEDHTFKYNGIDRINNKLGYTPENSISCCISCNMAKREKTISEFKSWIERAYKNLFLDRYQQIA